jgi:integrase
MRLTDKSITALTVPAGRAEQRYFDADIPGFGLRRRRGGADRWIFQYDIHGRTRIMTLGSPKIITAGRARETASALHAKVRLGEDPAGDKAESKVLAGETFGALVDRYLAKRGKTFKQTTLKNRLRYLQKHCRPFHSLPLSKIDRRAVASRLAKLEDDSGPIEANRVHAALSAFFNWCIGEGYIEDNPAEHIVKRQERSRDHVLTDSELRAIWAATSGGDDYSSIVRLLLLTACRADEIGSLSHAEIFGDRIVLPGSRTKNSRDHIVPLSTPAQEILKGRLRVLGRDYVFGRGDNGHGFTGWSPCKKLLDARIKGAGAKVEHWVNHDLRRTVATRMADLGVAPHVIEAVLNHVSGHKHGVAGIYNRSTYAAEKTAALVLWADHLLSIVEGRPMPRRKRPRLHLVEGGARKAVPLRA